MAGRFNNPFPQFFTSTPTVYSGGVLRFYQTGTSTPLSVYTNAALTTGAATSVTLNSAGRPAQAIFLQNQSYKVTLEDSSGNIIWTADPVNGSDFLSLPLWTVGSGSPNGSVAGTAASAGVMPSVFWDYTNLVLYVCTTTGSSSTAVWTAVGPTTSSQSVPPPQGYLTLVTATPVITSDQSAKTTVYYTPDAGSLIPIYNGSIMVPTEFSELSLALVASHVASAIYDIFVWSESGVLTVGTGPAWQTATAGSGARGTGASTTELTRVKGLYVNAVSMTTRNGSTTYSVGANRATYVGSIFMDGSNGQVSCLPAWGASRKWGLWNAYNRRLITLQAGDSTASWNYATATIRASRAQSTNSLTVFCGLLDPTVELSFTQHCEMSATSNNAGLQTANIGIGVNSTTAFSGKAGTFGVLDDATIDMANATDPKAQHYLRSLGINTITALEKGNAGTGVTTTFYGGNDDMMLTARWLG